MFPRVGGRPLVRLGLGDVCHGVVGDLVASDIPVGDHGVVGVVERSKVGHFWRTAAPGAILPLRRSARATSPRAQHGHRQRARPPPPRANRR